MNKKIGFIGLGQMGKWMATNLLKAGFDLTVCDLNTDAVKFLTDQGSRSARTASELAQKVDLIFLSLPDTAVVETALFGENGLMHGARPGQIVLDLGTSSYMQTLEFSARLRDKGIVFSDAPVSGMEARAKDAALTIMFGGSEDLLHQLMPLLKIIGNKIVHMGPVGTGQLTKLVNQLLFNTSMAALAEILPMAVKLGLDPEKVAEVVTTGTGRSFGLEFFTPHILNNRFDHGYPLESAYKDMISASEISARRKIPMPLVKAATTTYQMALAQGYGNEDKGAMIKVFEQMLGVQFRKKQDR